VIVQPEFRRSPLAIGVVLTVAGFLAEGRIWRADRQNFRGSSHAGFLARLKCAGIGTPPRESPDPRCTTARVN
jgi:hypothetical protein